MCERRKRDVANALCRLALYPCKRAKRLTHILREIPDHSILPRPLAAQLPQHALSAMLVNVLRRH
jgi:hypothetical protein